MVFTRRKAHLKAALENEHILKLPSELLHMIFDHFVDEPCKPWLASLATLCKPLMPEVEAALYREASLESCKRVSILCRSIVKRKHRAVFLRKLVISVRGGASIKQPLKNALPLLTSLSWLELSLDEPSIFDILLDVPFRLRNCILGGETYTPHLEDILARQPDIERLSLAFMPASDEQAHPQISRPDILPNLQALTVFATRFPLTTIAHPYHVAHLSIMGASHDDITHVVNLFSSTLETFCLLRVLDDDCTAACYWPTSTLRNARLPKLEHLKVTDLYGPFTDVPCEADTMPVPGLTQGCPALKTIMWSVDMAVMDDLYAPGVAPGDMMMATYARVLFDALPALGRLAIHELGDTMRGPGGAIYGEVFRRGDEGAVTGPANEPIDMDAWALYAELI